MCCFQRGLNGYIFKGVVGNSIPLEIIFQGILWFLSMDILTLAILIAWLEISLWLLSAIPRLRRQIDHSHQRR